MNRRRAARLVAAVVAVGVMTTAIGACSSDGSSTADLAQQDRAVASANKTEKQNLDKMKAAIRKKWQARAKARRAAAAAAAQSRPRPRTTVIVGSTRVGGGDVCAPIRPRFRGPAGRAERRFRMQQRRKVLGYLNLHCPSLSVPRV
jgi:hypothetical protein